MPSAPTIGSLFKAKAITDDAINAAVDAYLAGKANGAIELGEGIAVDVGAAVKAHGPAQASIDHPDRTDKFKRTMVRTAILLASPEEG